MVYCFDDLCMKVILKVTVNKKEQSYHFERDGQSQCNFILNVKELEIAYEFRYRGSDD